MPGLASAETGASVELCGCSVNCHEGRLKWRGRYQGTKAPQAIQTDIAQEQALGLGQIEERFFDATCDSEDADCTTDVTVL